MGQFNYKKDGEATATPYEWMGASASVGRLVNKWSDRDDIVAYVAPEIHAPFAACYNPKSAEVEVNVKTCFMDGIEPSEVEQIENWKVQFEWPKATGAIFHEACHARYSQWSLEDVSRDLTDDEFSALVLLEEGRIEKFGLSKYPENLGFLRATALELVIRDEENVFTNSDTRTAGNIAGLALARVDAGSVLQEDVEGLHDLVEAKLGKDRLEQLREIWLTVQSHSKHDDVTELYDLARQWVRIISEASEENGDAESEESFVVFGSGGSSSSDGDGSEGSEQSDFAKALKEALEQSMENAQISSYDVLVDAETKADWEDQLKEMNKKDKVKQENIQIATEVFGSGTSEGEEIPSSSSLIEERTPRSEERIAAVKISNLLEKARYRERSETEIKSQTPPGRLNTRSMVQGAAYKSNGILSKVEPWRRTARKHTDDPKLTIGVMVDVSGSMSEAMNSMATMAWVLSEVSRRIEASSAMVYYGSDVFSTLKPGQHLDKVRVYGAYDYTEKFDKAFRALDGSLNLLNGSGARLLVIFSDGQYTAKEIAKAKHWLAMCKASNVGVLWLGLDSAENYGARDIVKDSTAVFMRVPKDTSSVATAIGQAAAKALTLAS